MLYVVKIVIVFIIVLLLLLSAANPTFDFRTGSGTLMAGVVQETECAPAVTHGVLHRSSRLLVHVNTVAKGVYGNSGAGV